MEKETYLKILQDIEDEAKSRREKLYKEYALSNAKFKIGETIRDSRWSFVIDKITTYKAYDFPVAVYHGFELKKDLTPRKDKNRVAIYGNDAELIKSN